MADEAGVAVTLPNPGRRTSLPARFREGQVLESTGRRDQGMLSVYDSYKALYFQVVDKVLMELDKRFGESRSLLKSIAVLSPKNPSFLDMKLILPLAECYKLDIALLSNQLEIARVFLNQRNIETVEDCLNALGENHAAFPEAIKLFKIALTVPVASASAERSFSVLKRIKNYLRSTIGQQRLNDLSILAIEQDLAKSLNFDLVVDIFMRQNLRRIILV